MARDSAFAYWPYQEDVADKIGLLMNEIDICRRDVSAWKHWLDTWAPHLRELWRQAGSGRDELRDRVAELELRSDEEKESREELSERLQAHAQVTVSRLESLEQALVEWNQAAIPFSDRLDRGERNLIAAGEGRQQLSARLDALEGYGPEKMPVWMSALIDRIDRLERAAWLDPTLSRILAELPE